MNTAYEEGMKLFKNREYAGAMECLVSSYEAGEKKEEIMQLVSDCFWTPNLEEMKRTYEENSEGITAIKYEELPLAFIPVSDELFYVFDMEADEFSGTVDMTLTNYWEEGAVFESVLVTDCWDCRQIREAVGENFPPCVYVRPSDEGRYVSFLQIPGFGEKYMGNHLMMNSDELMELYFREMKDVYLPKEIISRHSGYYQDLIEKLHWERVRAPKEDRNNIYISVCIPSWNRGGEALRAVSHLVQSSYDAEVEIIVSNNGSTENTEGYDSIRDMEDSRIVYHRFEENMGIGANITKVLELARGKYALLQSDQDVMVVENLGHYLNNMSKYGDAIGAVVSQGTGGDFMDFFDVSGTCSNRVECIGEILCKKYLTGMWFKVQNLIESRAFSLYEEWKENQMIHWYPHIFYGLLALGENIIYIGAEKLWIAGSDSQKALSRKDIGIYCQPESRMHQCEAAMELVDKIFRLREEELALIMKTSLTHVYRLITLAITWYGSENIMGHDVRWKETCKEIFVWTNEQICKYEEKMNPDTAAKLREDCRVAYKQYSEFTIT